KLKKFSFILFLALASCQLFDKKVPDESKLLKQELQKINWNDVDEYPNANSCDTILNLDQQKVCFFNYITHQIKYKINLDSIQILFPNLDTIQIKITNLPDSTSIFEIQYPKDSLTYNIKLLDCIIQTKLANFPLIEPASKRGIKVKTQFILPLVIRNANFETN
ncbi:hypothetical protein, partial [uncultured Flavobacterium sp.]|uniref:hypothetical protein n=1 Tax=uncultured Flavobacterium sp. TaxID=165435 RepID=UPI0030CA3EDB